jgi:hypothetical protein
MPVDSLEPAHHHGWPETKAEVTSCKFVRAMSIRSSVSPAYFAVGFSYKVDGISYQGVTTSSVAVECHDKFALRYNPEHPDQNNSIGSVCDRPWFKDYLYIVGALFATVILYDLVTRYLPHR